jgi:hypothetical protein
MQHDTTQQHSEGSLGTQVLSQDEVKSLHVGLLLFGSKDFYAIRDALLPHKKVGLLQQYSRCLSWSCHTA